MALTIDSIKQRIFNNTKHESVVSRSTNPFAQTSFKGNVLTADVFQTENIKEAKPSLNEKMHAKSKLMYSALVGSISDFGSKINSKLESVVAFGSRMKENVSGAWNYLRTTKIEDVIKDRMMDSQYSIENLSKKSPSELGEMWKDCMSLQAIG